MEIIDNFGLQTRHNAQDFSWMVDAMRELEQSSSKAFIVRLNGKRSLAAMEFELHNGVNKTQANITGYKHHIRVILFARGVPDPTKGFRPPMEVKDTITLPLDKACVKVMADILRKHLEQDTPYSLDTITKVKVSPTAKPLEPWSFAGGKVTHMEHVDGGISLTVEDGKQVYFIPTSRLYGRKPAGFKYVLINEHGDCDFVGSNEFHFYFEMKYVD